MVDNCSSKKQNDFDTTSVKKKTKQKKTNKKQNRITKRTTNMAPREVGKENKWWVNWFHFEYDNHIALRSSFDRAAGAFKLALTEFKVGHEF